MHEHARIARFFAPLAAGEPGAFGLTDDAAVLTPPEGAALVTTTDSVIQGVHVMPDATPRQYAQKLARRNLSDLAAMGAVPWRYLLNLHTPHAMAEDWFAAFAAALAEEQAAFGMALAGGDTTSGGDAVHVTMTCFGLLNGPALRRHGAQAGDDLYVSGTIGDAAIGLQLLQHRLQKADAAWQTHFIRRYHRPEPRLALGAALAGVASAGLDISDGLLADVMQLCRAGGVGAAIRREAIPRTPELQHALQQNPTLWEAVLQGGDDYELCFTAAPALRGRIAELAAELALPLTCIGSVTAERRLLLLDGQDQPMEVGGGGWEYP